MGHQKGAHLGSARTLEDLRLRCVIDDQEDPDCCWSFRQADGRRFPQGRVPRVWLYGGTDAITAARAAWLLSHPGQELRNGWRVYRTCSSPDCINPRHLRAGTCAQMGKVWVKTGKMKTPAKQRAARTVPKPLQKLTPELKVWLAESEQSHASAAHAVGVCTSRVAAVREAMRNAMRLRPGSSVFSWRPHA